MPLGGRQQQVVLALLLTAPNTVVSTSRLIDEIWGESPPATARKAVQSHIAILRKAINVADEYIVGRGNGYLVELARSRVTRTLTDEECQQYLRLETCDAR